MNAVCRLCLEFEANMTPIFNEDRVNSELRSKIKDFCLVEVSENDVLPKMICNKCYKKLSFIEEFRTQCKHSDIRLREHYNISIPNKPNKGSSLNVVQDIGMRSEDELKEDSTFSKCLLLSRADNKLELDTALGIEGNDVEREEISNSLSNSMNSIDNYESEDKLMEKNYSIGKKKTITKSKCNERLQLIKTKKLKFACNLCEKVYVSKKAILKHTKAHMNKEIVMCKVCNKAFNNSDKLSEHIKKHNENIDLKCEVCGMPFKEQVKLNFHLRVHGKGPPINTEKHYLCDLCSRTFASKSGLRFHLKSHAGTKPYKCRYCNKCFTIPSYKKRHERTHTGDKHFVCHICKTGFASANGLKYHLRSHTGEANYHCTTCGKSFRREKYLKEHTFTHTGERPFICKICGSTYGNSGSLFVHEKKCKTRYSIEFIDISKI